MLQQQTVVDQFAMDLPATTRTEPLGSCTTKGYEPTGQAFRRMRSASCGLWLKLRLLMMLYVGLSNAGSAFEPGAFLLHSTRGLVVDVGPGVLANPPASCNSAVAESCRCSRHC